MFPIHLKITITITTQWQHLEFDDDEFLPNSENGSYEIDCKDLDYIPNPVKQRRNRIKKLIGKKENNDETKRKSGADIEAKKELKYKAWNIRMKAKLGDIDELLLIP